MEPAIGTGLLDWKIDLLDGWQLEGCLHFQCVCCLFVVCLLLFSDVE